MIGVSMRNVIRPGLPPRKFVGEKFAVAGDCDDRRRNGIPDRWSS